MHRLVVFALGAMLVGCGSSHARIAGKEIALPCVDDYPREGKTVRRVGVMWSFTGDTADLVHVPAVTRINRATTVVVEVSGRGCSGPDTTTASVDGLVATIVPYQRVFTPVPPNGACAESLAFDSRAVRITFPLRGTARARIVYRQGEAGPLTMTERSNAVQ